MTPSLPGADLVERGIDDLGAGRESDAALLIAMAAPRLRRLGLDVPDPPPGRPAHLLYDRLARRNPRTAHSHYNALVGRMASYARAAEHARSR